MLYEVITHRHRDVVFLHARDPAFQPYRQADGLGPGAGPVAGGPLAGEVRVRPHRDAAFLFLGVQQHAALIIAQYPQLALLDQLADQLV